MENKETMNKLTLTNQIKMEAKQGKYKGVIKYCTKYLTISGVKLTHSIICEILRSSRRYLRMIGYDRYKIDDSTPLSRYDKITCISRLEQVRKIRKL